MSNMSNSNVTVVGIGAMGGGMARALLRCPATKTVAGYDRAEDRNAAFHSEASVVQKSPSPDPPKTLEDAVTASTDIVLLVLVNEIQCQRVCFGGTDEDSANLFNLLPGGACVVLCSTVTARWAEHARDVFARKEIHFVDCPISGGAAKALTGDLTMMASGSAEALKFARPLLNACGSQIHIIKGGGAGMGQKVKMAHQLLAGVHVVSTAEALSLSATAGIDPRQMYDIVRGAAGNSWMFGDRGGRMIGSKQPPPVKSALPILIKDMDIVYKSAKDLGCPIPLASAALQQLLTASAMGLDGMDDSQVVRVYEKITGVPVGKAKEEVGTSTLGGAQYEILGLKGKAGEIWNGRKCHIYDDHLDDGDRIAVTIAQTGQSVKVRQENIRKVDPSASAGSATPNGSENRLEDTSPEKAVSLRERIPKIKRKLSRCAVIGIGNIGGGMARALLASECTCTVTGYDRDMDLVKDFHKEAQASKKAHRTFPTKLSAAATESDVVVLALVNETQCESVCFGGESGDNLLTTMAKGSCVLLSSTVSAQWARHAEKRFDTRGIYFVDSPVSGGAERARAGELTMMASGSEMAIGLAMPVLEACGKEVHLVDGGSGMGQTAKFIHQLLAGVHIVAAAESLVLAAKAGIDPHQFYQIVCGAAGCSWMFQDRGRRMLQDGDPKVMSMIDIFVKDLRIVHTEAMGVKSPIPLASVALQQFGSASALGLGKKDDSQVILVYAKYLGASERDSFF